MTHSQLLADVHSASIHALPAKDSARSGKRTIEPLRKKIDRFSAQLYANVEAKARELLDRVIRAWRDTDDRSEAQLVRLFSAKLLEEHDATASSEIPLLRRLIKRFATSLSDIDGLRTDPAASDTTDEPLPHQATAYREALDVFLEETISFMVEGTERKATFDAVVRPLGGSLFFY
jgi:hypothetical protein